MLELLEWLQVAEVAVVVGPHLYQSLEAHLLDRNPLEEVSLWKVVPFWQPLAVMLELLDHSREELDEHLEELGVEVLC